MTSLLDTVRPQDLTTYPRPVLTGSEIITITLGEHTYSLPLKDLRPFMQPNLVELGLDNIDNTPDSDKPVSEATLLQLNEKADLTHTHVMGDVEGLIAILDYLKTQMQSPSVAVEQNEW